MKASGQYLGVGFSPFTKCISETKLFFRLGQRYLYHLSHLTSLAFKPDFLYNNSDLSFIRKQIGFISDLAVVPARVSMGKELCDPLVRSVKANAMG